MIAIGMLEAEQLGLFQPDLQAHHEYLQTQGSSLPGPKRLCLAMLEQAFADLQLPNREPSRISSPKMRGFYERQHTSLARQARDWITRDEPDWEFSFVSCCATLGISATAIRRQVLGRPTP